MGAIVQKLLCLTLLLLAIVVDANYIRGRHTLGRKRREASHLKTHPVDMEHCRDGRKRKCECSDDSLADLTQRVCPQGANIDQVVQGARRWKEEVNLQVQ